MPKVDRSGYTQPVGVFLGIDPGDNGAASILDTRGKLLQTMKCVDRSEREIFEWFRSMASLYDIKASLEKVGPRPGFSVQSQFYLAESFGFLRGMLVALDIPFVLTTPQSWQKTLSIPKRDTKKESTDQFKKRLVATAQQRWPKDSALISKGNADSLLISEALRLTEVGGK